MIGLLISTLLSVLSPPSENFMYHHRVKAKSGDGVLTLLSRYHLADQPCNVEAFCQLNGLSEDPVLYAGKKYILPVLIYRYNGTSIRSTIKNDNYEKAVRIQLYNEKILANNLRKTHYTDSKILWVPHHELHCAEEPTESSVAVHHKAKTYNMPVLGPDNARVTVESDILEGQVFYLVTGHGGPDPGAVGSRGDVSLCEDEYAYDVVLRLYKLLLEHGAQPYLIIEDKNDGIRSEKILPCDRDETCHGARIPLNQLKRLQQRVAMVNDLYLKNRKKGFTQQTFISIHVDSRGVNHKQDVFFCHYPTSKSSRAIATSLQKTFADKYRQHRKNNSYGGEVSPRSNLYVLKNTYPPAVLVELANIQNRSDHQRILEPSNRQALAKWMLEGLIAHQDRNLAAN